MSEAKQCTYQLWVLLGVDNIDVVELDVQVLINGMERARQCDIILQLHRNLLPNQRLEKRVK